MRNSRNMKYPPHLEARKRSTEYAVAEEEEEDEPNSHSYMGKSVSRHANAIDRARESNVQY